MQLKPVNNVPVQFTNLRSTGIRGELLGNFCRDLQRDPCFEFDPKSTRCSYWGLVGNMLYIIWVVVKITVPFWIPIIIRAPNI